MIIRYDRANRRIIPERQQQISDDMWAQLVFQSENLPPDPERDRVMRALAKKVIKSGGRTP